jgi:hypothetical protein
MRVCVYDRRERERLGERVVRDRRT